MLVFRWARALLLAVTIAAAKKKKRSRKPPATEKVKLTPGEYCLACLAFVEDYHKSISDIYQRNAATARVRLGLGCLFAASLSLE